MDPSVVREPVFDSGSRRYPTIAYVALSGVELWRAQYGKGGVTSTGEPSELTGRLAGTWGHISGGPSGRLSST
jgi:hypothetical protein